MIDLVSLAVGGFVVGGVYATYSRLTGCSGGHYWGEWEPQDRWRITPYAHADSVGVKREYERECEREGCTGSESKDMQVVGEAYAPSEETLLEALTEAHYECSKCETAVPDSDRSTHWKDDRYGATRMELCPNCGANRMASMWDRVERGDVE
jgi:DNA-directed RNA polymerase subunit RPC12/RpoP